MVIINWTNQTQGVPDVWIRTSLSSNFGGNKNHAFTNRATSLGRRRIFKLIVDVTQYFLMLRYDSLLSYIILTKRGLWRWKFPQTAHNQNGGPLSRWGWWIRDMHAMKAINCFRASRMCRAPESCVWPLFQKLKRTDTSIPPHAWYTVECHHAHRDRRADKVRKSLHETGSSRLEYMFKYSFPPSRGGCKESILA